MTGGGFYPAELTTSIGLIYVIYAEQDAFRLISPSQHPHGLSPLPIAAYDSSGERRVIFPELFAYARVVVSALYAMPAGPAPPPVSMTAAALPSSSADVAPGGLKAWRLKEPHMSHIYTEPLADLQATISPMSSGRGWADRSAPVKVSSPFCEYMSQTLMVLSVLAVRTYLLA